MQRPLIGVPTQTLQAMDGMPPGLPVSWVMNHRYFTALAAAGAVPVMVPLLEDEAVLRSLYERLDGVFLAGGLDVDPASYERERELEACGRTDPPRDRVELTLTRWAVTEGKPFLGVCRGLQILNVSAGGTLYQDTIRFPDGALKHDFLPNEGHAREYLAHDVRLVPGSRAHGIFGRGTIRVNSMHHQGIDAVGEGLAITGVAPDGLVEVLEMPGGSFALAVQWHPESLIDTDLGTRRLFEAFVEAARAWRPEGAPLQLS